MADVFKRFLYRTARSTFVNKSPRHGQHLLRCSGRIASHHATLWHRAQPGELAFGELARGADALVAQVGKRWNVVEWVSLQRVQIVPRLAVTDAAHGGQVGVQIAACAQRFDFFQKAAGEHRIKTLGDALVQPGAVEWLK